MTCDAQLCTDDAGNIGRIQAIVSRPGGAVSESVPIGECSDDRVQVWHGLDTPAIACGKHARYSKIAVFRGHRNRIKAAERLEYLRGQIRAECISYGEIAELESLSDYIEPGDAELLEWAGVSEEEAREQGRI